MAVITPFLQQVLHDEAVYDMVSRRGPASQHREALHCGGCCV